MSRNSTLVDRTRTVLELIAADGPMTGDIASVTAGRDEVRVQISGERADTIDAMLAWFYALDAPYVELYDGDHLLVEVHGTWRGAQLYAFAGLRGDDAEFMRTGVAWDDWGRGVSSVHRVRKLQMLLRSGGAR